MTHRQEITCSNIDAGCGSPDDMLCISNMDTHKRARKNDSIDATQNAPTHHTNEKKIQKDRETKKRDQRTNDLGSTGDESDGGQSSITHNDQDSDVHSITIQTKNLTLQRLKKKTGLNT